MPNAFDSAVKENLPKLKLFVPVVDRVHGPTHPEFHEVKALFDTVVEKLDAGESDVSAEFAKLREVTNDYTVPSDVCESYEAVYVMLSELDAASRA